MFTFEDSEGMTGGVKEGVTELKPCLWARLDNEERQECGCGPWVAFLDGYPPGRAKAQSPGSGKFTLQIKVISSPLQCVFTEASLWRDGISLQVETWQNAALALGPWAGSPSRSLLTCRCQESVSPWSLQYTSHLIPIQNPN